MANDPRVVPQLPLQLRTATEQGFAQWLGDGAVALRLQDWATGGSAEALFLQGAPGSGKTHLAMACCAAAESAGRRAAYLALGSVHGRVAAATEGIHAADLVVLDQIEAIAGTRADEDALFDLHNRLHDAGKPMLYLARSGPAGLPLALPDLRSRLAQSTLLALPAPDDALRTAVLRQRAQARGLLLEDAAIDWMLSRTGRELGALVALLDRLDRASLAAQRRVTVPFLRQVLEAGRG
jgi:DnaA family protein